MRKSRTLRMTVLVMALALITSVFAVGTLSKYSIGGNGDDAARVAKWGVTIDITGTNSFATESSNGAIVSSNTNNVVAPGTSSLEAKLDADDSNNGDVVVTLKGKPEVDFSLTIDLGTTEDVVLKAGTYKDYTGATVDNARGDFTLAKDYYPVVFTFTHYYNEGSYSLEGCVGQSGVVKTTGTVATVDGYASAEAFTGTLAQMDAFFARISTVMNHVEANYTLDDQFKFTWEWVFGDSANNQADTMLGNLAASADFANLAKKEGDSWVNMSSEDYHLNLAYQFTIDIEQID